MRTTCKFLMAAGIVFAALATLASPANAQGFDEQFNSSTLDPAWQVVQFSGTRVYGYSTPANHFSLTDNPGFLRYGLDPMTHWDGFTYNFQTSYGLHSCCNHDPGLELRRAIGGENWLLEAHANYFLPYVNGRGLTLNVYFGGGGVGTFSVQFQRGRDVNQNYLRILLAKKTGPDPWNYPLIEDYVVPYDIYGPNNSEFYYRLNRAGGELTAMWSADGDTWTTAFNQDLGTDLDGLEQRVILTGISWYLPQGSYADWNYVSVTPANRDPVAVAGLDQTVECTDGNCADVTLDGAGSWDPDGDALSYEWTGPFGTVEGVNPVVSLPVGQHTITLTVTDSNGATSSDSVVHTVVHEVGPSLGSLSASPATLWPPDHRMVPISLSAVATDACDPAPVARILSVTSNEPINGLGDGDSAPDWEITGDLTLLLRAERSGTGSGRVYTITVQATDSAGNLSEPRTLAVTVPKSQKGK